MKSCNKCLIEKPLIDFYMDKNGKYGRYSSCKECKNKRTEKWREKNREHYNRKMREYNAANKDSRRDCDYKRKYGISLEQYNSKLESQNNKCWICEKKAAYKNRKMVVDHCHNSGRARGILCYGCNRALSILESGDLLRRAQEYLEHFGE